MNIKSLPKSERPRERMISFGPSSLSNEELLSILLRCGNKNESVKELSLQILKKASTVSCLSNLTYSNLLSIKGVGPAKATVLLAAIELGKRIVLSDNISSVKCSNPTNIFNNTKYLFEGKKQEYFYCLYLDNKNKLIDKKLLFIGTVNRSLVHPREVFKYAYLYSASGIICLHNHPSGEVEPSKDDIILTSVLCEIGNIQKIPILDHIIIGEDTYYSFSDNGKINNR